MLKKKDDKPLTPNPLLSEELFDYLNEIIESSGAECKEEISNIINSTMGLSIDAVRKRVKMTPRLKAKKLMYRAIHLPENKGRQLAEKALAIYPDCVDAFIYYGDICEEFEDAEIWYRRAVQAGERDIGAERFEEEAGNFWGVNVTRPYMRARALYASTLVYQDKIDEAIVEYQDMLRLNPADNQGIRFELVPLLIIKRRYKEYLRVYEQFEDEVTFGWLYTYFLYLFIKFGAVKKTQDVLRKAISYNPYIIEYLITDDDIPENEKDFYAFGDETEAYNYLDSCLDIWIENPKALKFLYDFLIKYKEQN